MPRTLRAELGVMQGTVQRVATQLGYEVESSPPAGSRPDLHRMSEEPDWGLFTNEGVVPV